MINTPGVMVKKVRQHHGWSQQVLAGKLRIHRQYLSLIENKPKVPKSLVDKLDKILGGPAWRDARMMRGPVRVDADPVLKDLYDNTEPEDLVTRGILEIIAEMKDRIERIELRGDKIIHVAPPSAISRRHISKLQN